jgi:hypothetical protein
MSLFTPLMFRDLALMGPMFEDPFLMLEDSGHDQQQQQQQPQQRCESCARGADACQCGADCKKCDAGKCRCDHLCRECGQKSCKCPGAKCAKPVANGQGQPQQQQQQQQQSGYGQLAQRGMDVMEMPGHSQLMRVPQIDIATHKDRYEIACDL